ncbi:hypothetical protein BDM02DRAFT_525377 [Thelephora ganbajun]|uniref:Uncharacterized protein n=1 Tax=Thelephora ganbajun TaxID=370292 RepID=A0ACB6ZRN8_THEGA|nr:hypothetical protein BDM02DRAFT_525377 [Thelephora ganbajun]
MGRGRCHHNVFNCPSYISPIGPRDSPPDKVRPTESIKYSNFPLSSVPRSLTGLGPANMAVRLTSSIFVGFVLESLIYGAFIMIFIAAAVTQRERWKHEKLRTGNKLVMGFSILLLGFISTHWILNFRRCYDVFLSGSDLATMEGLFANQRNATNLARFIVYEVQAWMGDCLLIYRLYHVCGLKLNVLDPESTGPFHTWAVVCFTLTFGENLYCLVAIALFIWRAQYDIRHVTTSPLTAVMWIFIESAGMWLLFVGLTFFVYLGDPTVSLAFVYITNPMLGVSFCLMVTRLNLHSQRRSRASFAYVAKNLDLDIRQSKEIDFTPVGLYVPRPSNIPTTSPSNGSKPTDSFLSIPLS